MNRLIAILATATALIWMAAPQPTRAAATVELARDGTALASVQIAPDASVETRSVATELAQYLQRISGAGFDVVRERRAGARIVLGTHTEFPEAKLGPELREMGSEAFVMRTAPDELLLIGASDLAVSHAAFAFLEHLGCRWFFPMDDWRIVPEMESIRVQLDEKQAPDMMVRSIWYATMHPGFPQNSLRQDWMRHNRMPGTPIAISHTWVGLDPVVDFERSPEMFALVNGERKNSKPCYSHPGVIRSAIKYALAEAEQGAKSVTVSAPDGLGFCECEKCFAVFQGGEPYEENLALLGKRPDGEVVSATSETIFAMANKVAEAVAAKYPDVLIGCMAYSGYAHPPSFDLHPNVYIEITAGYRRTPLSIEQQIEAFGRKTRQMGIYEYYFVVVWHGHTPAGGKKLPYLSKQMPYYYANGVRGINGESTNSWAAGGLEHYVAAKLMWDVSADVDALYADFLAKAFGAAQEPMKRYYDRWQDNPELTDELLTAATRDLLDAYARADSPDVKRRVGQMYLYQRFIRLGRDYDKLKEDAEAASAPGKAYGDFFWRMQHSLMLHDHITRGVSRPVMPAFTTAEVEGMMREDARSLTAANSLPVRRPPPPPEPPPLVRYDDFEDARRSAALWAIETSDDGAVTLDAGDSGEARINCTAAVETRAALRATGMDFRLEDQLLKAARFTWDMQVTIDGSAPIGVSLGGIVLQIPGLDDFAAGQFDNGDGDEETGWGDGRAGLVGYRPAAKGRYVHRGQHDFGDAKLHFDLTVSADDQILKIYKHNPAYDSEPERYGANEEPLETAQGIGFAIPMDESITVRFTAPQGSPGHLTGGAEVALDNVHSNLAHLAQEAKAGGNAQPIREAMAARARAPEAAHGDGETVRIAGIVLKWIRGDKEANYRRAEPMIREAAKNGARIICTTECFLDGYAIADKTIPLEEYRALGEPIPDGRYYRKLAALARELQIHLIAGMTEADGDARYNTAVLIGPDGKLEGKYRKQMLDHESVRNTAGKESTVHKTPFGPVGVMICADRRFPEVVGKFRENGAGLLICPSGGMFGPKNNDPLLQARSKENQVPIVFVHPALFLVTGPDGSILERTLLGDVLLIARDQAGGEQDQNKICYFDLPLGSRIQPESTQLEPKEPEQPTGANESDSRP